jgi:hypothetical protein
MTGPTAAAGPGLAVLASGSGTLLESILARGLRPAVVIADRPCRALEVASAAGMAAAMVERTSFGAAFDRSAYTEEVVRVLKDAGVGTVAMAGFMTVLAPPAFATFPDRILNTHPSLLPAFPGAHAVRDALAFGEAPQSGRFDGRGMDEYVLAAAVWRDEAEPFLGIVRGDRTDTFLNLRIIELPMRGSAYMRQPPRDAPDLGSACIHFEYCTDLWPLLPSADLHLEAGARRQALISFRGQQAGVKERIESAVHGHKTKALGGTEPFDDGVSRLPPASLTASAMPKSASIASPSWRRMFSGLTSR